MSKLRTSALNTALVAAALLGSVLAAPASATVRPATIAGYGLGTGTTAALAQRDAVRDLHSNYNGCGPWSLDYDKPGGVGWEARVTATCDHAN